MRRFLVLAGLLLVFLLSGIGCLRFLTCRTLRLVEAQYAIVDRTYRNLFWKVRYVESGKTDADLQKFITDEIPKLVSISQIQRLQFLQNWFLSRSENLESVATMNGLKVYLHMANIDLGPDELKSSQSATYIGELLRRRLQGFKFISKNCTVSYSDLKKSVAEIEASKAPTIGFDCFNKASEKLLASLRAKEPAGTDPYVAFFKVTIEKKQNWIWAKDELSVLIATRNKIKALVESKEQTQLQKNISKQLSPLGTPQRSEEIARWFYRQLGFSTEGVRLEKHPKENKSFGGLHFAVRPPKDVRVLISDKLKNGPHYLPSMVHEMGHAAYYGQVKQRVLALKYSPSEPWFNESIADLFVCLFFEPVVLSQSPTPLLRTQSKNKSLLMRRHCPAAVNLMASMPSAHFQMLAIQQPQTPLNEVAAQFLKQWPDHFSHELRIHGFNEKTKNMYLAMRELEWLVYYPLYYAAYVEGALIIAAIAEQYFKGKPASWPDLLRLSKDLREMFAYGGTKGPEELLAQLNVNPKDRQALINGLKNYLGVQ